MKALILDSGAVTGLARRNRQETANIRLDESPDTWSAVVPSLVLVECLSGRPHNDAVVNRFLKSCTVVDGPHEKLARRAGTLRAKAGRGSAVDAVIVAMAEPGGAILTGDVNDIAALATHARDVRVFRM